MSQGDQATPLPISQKEARALLEDAKRSYETSKTYHNSRVVQVYQREYDKLVEENRNAFFVIEGGANLHTLTKYEQLVSALHEISLRGLELTEQYKGIDMAPTSYIRYFASVADQALKAVGETDKPNEITEIVLNGNN